MKWTKKAGLRLSKNGLVLPEYRAKVWAFWWKLRCHPVNFQTVIAPQRQKNWKKWDPLFWSSICRLFFTRILTLRWKRKNWIHCSLKNSENYFLSLSTCCINTNQVTQMTIAEINSLFGLLCLPKMYPFWDIVWMVLVLFALLWTLLQRVNLSLTV